MSEVAAASASRPGGAKGREAREAGEAGVKRPGSVGSDNPQPDLGIDAARLRVAVLRLSRRLRKHDLAGLTPSQLSTLSTIGVQGPVRLGDLAAAERIAPSTLTRLINVLEDKGYVHRDAAPGDARAYLVSVTEQGRDVLERIKQEATNLLTDMLSALPSDQLGALASALPALEHLAGPR
jgi:DNA-binding MarR family transcriptional regulator